jgi:UDP-3-O-[3-hydroxymyristoyl] glucosamine N-acyltransferase
MRAAGLYFLPPGPAAGIHFTAVVDGSARIHPTAHVGAYCHIGADCEVGEGTVLHPHVVLYDRVRIGARCRVNSGTVIGADGFGYERNEAGELEKFPHLGGVIVADDVEIGSNTSIDRGSLGDTVIGARARVDNLVHVAHNVQIGEDCAVIALTMLGGSVRMGAGAWIAPGAVVMNQVAIGARSTVGLGAVVVRNVNEGETVMGAPAQNSSEFKATRAALARLAHG